MKKLALSILVAMLLLSTAIGLVGCKTPDQTKVAYTVQYNANGGTGTMESQAFTYDEAQNLTANTFAKTGYHFGGWSTTAQGDVVYRDNQRVSNLTTINADIVTLYAVWDLLYSLSLCNDRYTSVKGNSITSVEMPVI